MLVQVHRSTVRAMRYNVAKEVVISADDKGVIEYWSPKDYTFPSDSVNFRFKLDTDLYSLAKVTFEKKFSCCSCLSGKQSHVI